MRLQILGVLVLAWLGAGLFGRSEESVRAPLHTRIDELVALGNVGPVSPRASDATFIRRLYLDLYGRIPGVEEVRSFLADTNIQKRERLVDQLLNGRENTLHLARALDVWFMERRPDEQVKEVEWSSYLIDSVAADQPYDELVREILGADGSDGALRAAARFYLDRKGEPHLLARDVGRIFFGKDLQCAQCHDHPNIDDYLQRDYYGLFAFFNRTSFFQPDTKKPALLAETAEGEASFTSVFTGVKSEALPRVPGGREIKDPGVEPGEAYKVKPDKKDKKVRPIPTYSRRARLASAAVDGADRQLARNAVNRLWKQMMGKGLVEPPDYHHASNPPSHPLLLDLLADAFVEMKYDLRGFLRELALTETYQRSFELTGALLDQAALAAERMPELTSRAERLLQAAGEAGEAFDDGKEAWEAAAKRLSAETDKLAKVVKERDQATAARKKASEEEGRIAQELIDTERKMEALQEAAAKGRAAAEMLPKDEELAVAAAKFTERAGQVEAGVKAVRERLVSAEASSLQASEKLNKAESAVAALQKNVDLEAEKVSFAAEDLEAARDRRRTARTAAITAQRLVEDARQWVEYAKVREQAVALGEEAAGLADELASLEAEADRAQRVAADLTEAVARLESVLTVSAEDLGLGETFDLLKEKSGGARDRADAALQKLEDHRAVTLQSRSRAEEMEGAEEAALEALTERWSRSFALGVFEALAPEQLCASMMQASGHLDLIKAQGEAEFDKKVKQQEEAMREKKDAAGKEEGEPEEGKKVPEELLSESDRAVFVENHVREKTRGAFRQFIKLFGGQPGQPQTEFYATADQALFFSNDGLVRGWLRSSGNNLVARLGKMEAPKELADELYLAVLTREPEEEEVRQVSRMLETTEKPKAIQEMAWSLFSSVEFRFRH